MTAVLPAMDDDGNQQKQNVQVQITWRSLKQLLFWKTLLK